MLTYNGGFLAHTDDDCLSDMSLMEYFSSRRWDENFKAQCNVQNSANGGNIGEEALSSGGSLSTLYLHWGEAHNENNNNSDQAAISSRARNNNVDNIAGLGSRNSYCGHVCCNCQYFDVSGSDDRGRSVGGKNVYGLWVR